MPGEKAGLAGTAEERERADRYRHFDAAHASVTDRYGRAAGASFSIQSWM